MIWLWFLAGLVIGAVIALIGWHLYVAWQYFRGGF